MWFLAVKFVVSALLITAITEIAKRNDQWGGLLAALPLITVLSLFWLYFENQSPAKIANHAYYTFWYVIPTLPMFLVFPWMMPRLGFWWSMCGFVLGTALCFALFALLMRKFGIHLW